MPGGWIEDVRKFNRFYTKWIGALEEGFLRTPFTLAEARILWELAHRRETTASRLCRDLGLDPGYVSRILAAFGRKGLLAKRRSREDGRLSLLGLTGRGRRAFDRLNAASDAEIERLVGGLPTADRSRLVRSMKAVETLLGARAEPSVPYVLRPPRAGDMGWVVQSHGALYAEEYGWDATFEALVAEIVARYVRDLDSKRESCWIAERAGENVGSVFLVKHPERERVARLRLLLVDPGARGLGIGKKLVGECTRFARQAGYEAITLWTNSVLVAARRLYEAEGYRLVGEEPHRSFGKNLVGQTWELVL